MLKEMKLCYWQYKVTLYGSDGQYPRPFESLEKAEEEMEYYKGSKNVVAKLDDWTDEDQAWWNERKLQMIASFGAEYTDDTKAELFLQMFRPSAK